MKGVFTAQQVRDTERVLIDRLPEGTLMRRAAFGLAVHLVRILRERVGRVSGARVVLLVGAGDNGGDALWAGAELRRRGVAVTAVLLAPDRAHPAGLAALRAAGGRATSDGAGPVGRADLVVDGIVGISGRGALRDAAPALVDEAAAADVPVVAVDLPSGVDTDTGAVVGPAVTAAETVTFGALKPVHVLAAARCGAVHLVDIGLGPLLPEPHARVLDDADVADGWPLPGPTDDKYTQGVTGISAGSSTYRGAAVLATGAAVLATSGMVRYAGSAADGVRARWPEVVAADALGDAGRVQAWTVGPGLGADDAGRDALATVIAQDVPLCIDADAITLLGQHADLRDAVRGKPVIVTPHDREFARIAGEVGDDRIGAARRAAAELGVTVLLKGNATVVANPGGAVFVHPSAESWAATAGSGDVLSGIVGALLAAGRDPAWAGAAATHVHGMAAALAARGAPAPASEIEAHIPEAIRSLVAEN
ncbi:MAG: NAD(P)H-hydrate dehydratase [Pseudonocardia sp.]|uniref:NAD(P)H-hydrate dehydratase n=1 Tax=unclassified Pseudonocardia TaxID=2619320 RepID=UPI00086D99D8|nr:MULTISPECIES: NAD(P)H-hydrate dehydratase [unclassified Pseudonocardia]MBN9108745.1 NAD(P)H-hydrate dehydratase [Pseudonocardia sp.]ODU21064.1 MAG: bifunctional ADP-dependent (S)-NAD(P)H-hydrate dehydratase/NAD(P)H-hydrate epimerase [Pseudonocardia sp. SCN 72-51]ODV07641.1 MAG: bifunctional ADP-dependent (S)-NAD(P)H-hydrate dehydratase/NAD(P)H-hydrate epimerase [Pseudonocardia sp. SCN 73-27]